MSRTAKNSADRNRNQSAPRYVELIRVSSRAQEEKDTAENQRRELDRLAKRRPGQRIARIEALAVSGAIPLHETRAGKQLLDLANTGFDELRLWDLDRGLGARAEDPVDRLAFLSLAREAGAMLIDRTGQIIDPKNEIGEMNFILRTFFAAQERRKIMARTRAGRERIAAEGGYAGGGHLPYGLDWDRDARKFTIDEPRAALVRELYRRYLEGTSCNALAKEFNARGESTRLGGRWHQTTVNSILRSRAFRGEWTQEGITVAVPAIVDVSTWTRVQREMDIRARRGRKGKKTKSLCVGRLWCPCGHRIYVRKSKNREYLFCSSRRTEVHGRKPCTYSGTTHRADRIDPAVWDAVEDVITNPDVLKVAVSGEQDENSDMHQEELERCDERLQRLVDSEVTITRAFRRGELSAKAWQSQLKEIKSDRLILEQSREVAEQRIAAADAMTKSLDDVEAQVEKLRTRIQNAKPADRQAIVAALIPDHQPFGVIVWPDGQIAVRGALPTIGNEPELSKRNGCAVTSS